MKRDPTLECLRELAPLHGCNERELRRIDGLTCLRAVPAGTVLCRQGSYGRETFLVISGEAVVTIDDVELAHLGRGDFVGEMAVLEATRRTATVTALTAMELLVLSPTELETLLADVPSVARRLLATMSARLRLANAAQGEAVGRVEEGRRRNRLAMSAAGEDRR